jgi:hypothetical protein
MPQKICLSILGTGRLNRKVYGYENNGSNSSPMRAKIPNGVDK